MPGQVTSGTSVTNFPGAGSISGGKAATGYGETMSTAQDLHAREMALRSEYSKPMTFPRADQDDEAVARDVNNPGAALPARYDTDDALKERLLLERQTRDAIEEAERNRSIGGPKVVRTDPISDTEVAFTAEQERKKKLADFDQYVTTLIDPRKPGNMDWLLRVYPDYVKRRIEQINTDHQYALRNTMIDAWGINDYDDLMFKYMVDQNKISGPFLSRPAPFTERDAGRGILSFLQGEDKKYDNDALPYASAQFGRAPTSRLPLNAASYGSGMHEGFIRKLFQGDQGPATGTDGRADNARSRTRLGNLFVNNVRADPVAAATGQ